MDKAKLLEITKESSAFQRLEQNGDFQAWKKAVIEKRIEAYRQQMEASNPFSPEGDALIKKNLIAIQELRAITETIFRQWEHADNLAKKELASLD